MSTEVDAKYNNGAARRGVARPPARPLALFSALFSGGSDLPEFWRGRPLGRDLNGRRQLARLVVGVCAVSQRARSESARLFHWSGRARIVQQRSAHRHRAALRVGRQEGRRDRTRAVHLPHSDSAQSRETRAEKRREETSPAAQQRTATAPQQSNGAQTPCREFATLMCRAAVLLLRTFVSSSG